MGLPDPGERFDLAGRAAATDPDSVRPEVDRGRDRASAPSRARRATKTSTSRCGGNLNQTDYITAVSSAGVNVTATTITTTIYDSLGGSHEVQITYQPAGAGFNGGESLTPPTDGTQRRRCRSNGRDGMVLPSDLHRRFAHGATANLGTGFMFYDQNGQFINTSSAGNPPTAATVHVAGNGAAARRRAICSP